MSASLWEAFAASLLLFFVPGYAITKAVFPEWRIRGASAALKLVEVVTLSFLTSVTLTVLSGYALLSAGTAGFQAGWSDPVLEAVLAAIAAVGFVVGWFRGAYAHAPPLSSTTPDLDEPDPWSTVEALDRLRREDRRLRHALREEAAHSAEAERLRSELARVASEVRELSARREAEYAR